MLNGGIVPNIFSNEDLFNIRDDGKFKRAFTKDQKDGKTAEQSTPEALTEWLYTRIKDNMHLSICMSPIGERFRLFTRNYPALINNTTIDWFMPWPEQALTEVADKFIGAMDDLEDKWKSGLS
jgi:dynein heavy chain